jgi:tetratricopeptide (TPR) repeat protein
MISAMLHNVAAFRANEVRLADAFGVPLPEETRRALLETESTANYDMGIGTLSMSLLIPLMKAQLLATDRRYAEALEIFNDVLEKESPENLDRRKGCFYADRAWCHMKLDQPDLALEDVQRACSLADVPADTDDIASMHARIGEVLSLLGQQDKAATHKATAVRFRSAHASAQAELLDQLQAAIAALDKA